MDINGKTRVTGLIGNPVEHTLSPVIHNGISEIMHTSTCYVPFHVTDEGLDAAISGAYELNIFGLNVTVPHKNNVMEYLTDIDEAAQNIGAVNTLVRDKDRHGYKGYNTDMPGLRRQIHEDGIDLNGKTVVILGAGGASKAVVYMCILEGAGKIYILNRTIEKAAAIAEDMNRLIDEGVFAGDGAALEESASQRVEPISILHYDKITEKGIIVFQATSIGLYPNVNDVVIDDCEFYDNIDVGIDLIYNPAETAFMKLVKKHGGKAYNALKMLLYQAVIAYELWHDIKVPEDVIAEVSVALKRKVYSKNNIVLIGFMGCGKTSVGKRLAEQLSMNFIDTDAYIEERENMTISEIFESKGEAAFRVIETEAIKELRDKVDNTVFATGGGMPLAAENALLLKELGKVFYLTAANRVIYDRVKHDTKRPLLKCDDSYSKICRLMKERRPLYEKACDIIVDTNDSTFNEIIDWIMNCIN